MDDEHRRDIALFRFALIFDVVNEADLPHGAIMAHFRQVAAQEHNMPHSERTTVSIPTLKRWRRRYLAHGFEGLKPQGRSDQGSPRAFSEEVLEQACQLRREERSRSVPQIIRMLELNEDVAKDVVKPSTLARHFRQRGLDRQTLKHGDEGPYERFEAEAPNALWQSDVKYGPYLPDPADPEQTRRTYLIGLLDDHSRFILHGELYWRADLVRLADACKKAMIKHGLPKRLYVDNESFYVSPRFRAAGAELGIKVITGTPYHPQGRGKIERLWRDVTDTFLTELDTDNAIEANAFLEAWVAQHHNRSSHRSLPTTPRARFMQAEDEPRTASPETIHTAFLWRDERKVQKTATVVLEGNRYGVDPALIGRTVELRYDPLNLERMHVYHDGQPQAEAQPVDLTRRRHADANPDPAPAEAGGTGLNYLELLRDKHRRDQRRDLDGVAYRRLSEEESP